ncbi:hypothetical protein [Rhodovulum adriaticum]|uniref:hypothetical protein n=1 Tax=Rhodovulum adriaticum TaxID=35804 RepID=UPI001A912B4B|nr:hypothetical protein [Rhodovulum adriaticum]
MIPRTTILAALLAVALPAVAQENVAVPSDDDLRALRFYQAQGQEAAAELELRRLQREFPGWAPPEDIAAQDRERAQTEDEIYRMIATGELDAARRLIAQRQAQDRDWFPEPDMMRLLELAEAQRELDAAFSEDRLSDAIAIARITPDLLTCQRINNAWRLADAYQATGEADRALSIYKGVLAKCTALDQVTATMEKADALASPEQLGDLTMLAIAQAPTQTEALQRLEDRLRAGRGLEPRWSARSAFAGAVTVTAAQAGPDQIRPRARPDKDAQARPAVAAPAQSQPMVQGGAGMSRVRALAQVGNWRGCLAATSGASSSALLFERGWCAYNAKRPMEALDAFSRAEKRPANNTMRRDARFGMMLAYLDMQMTENAAALAARTELTRDQRIQVESGILDQRGVRAYQRGDFRSAIGYFDALEDLTGKIRRDLALLKGYAYLNSGKRAKAREIFLRLNNELVTPETRNALRAVR